jgi:uncharacterized protein (TIGR03437 family)
MIRRSSRLFCAVVVLSLPVGGQIITPVAGSDPIYKGFSGLAVNAALGSITGVAVAQNGTLYLSSYAVVVAATPSGTISVIAGNGTSGYSGDGGGATQAQLTSPGALTLDPAGDLYITDACRVRMVKNGIISTVAGSGTCASTGDGGPATAANLKSPGSLATDAAGNLYIADGTKVRMISGGAIQTIAGNGSGTGSTGNGGPALSATFNTVAGLAVDPVAGWIYVADSGSIRRFTNGGAISAFAGTGTEGFAGDNGPALSAQLGQCGALFLDTLGDLFLIDEQYFSYAPGSTISLPPVYRVRMVAPNGTITTVAGNGNSGSAGDGGPATSATFYTLAGIAGDSSGNLYLADSGGLGGGNSRARKVNGGIISTVAGNGNFRFGGDGGPATAALLADPAGIAVDTSGNLFIGDWGNNRIRKVAPSGTITTIAGNGVGGSAGDGGLATNATLNGPGGVALDSSGNLYVADFYNNRIRRISSSGIITTYAGTGQAGFSGDGGPATSATLNQPLDVATDASGNVYVSDYGNCRVRKITPGGTISTIAGDGGEGGGDGGLAVNAGFAPDGIGVNAAGDIYIGDTGFATIHGAIRKVSGGVISTVATTSGGTTPLALDGAGNVYFADDNAGSIKKFSPSTGSLTIIAGNGGPASTAAIGDVFGLAFDSAGDLFIARLIGSVAKITATAPSLSVIPGSLQFTAVEGTNPLPQEPTLLGSQAGAMWQATATTTSGGAWLSATPSAGLIPGSLTVTVTSASLQPGSYTGTVTVQVPGASPPSVSVTVQLTVTSAAPGNLTVTPATLTAQGISGGTNPSSQSISIGNTGGGTLNWTATTSTANGGSWLSLSSGSGSAGLLTPSVVQVVFNTAGLAPGVYSGTIVVVNGTQSQTVTVSLVLSPASPILLLSQSGLLFTAIQGGGLLAPQSVGVANVGTGSTNWTAGVSSGSWLTVTPASGVSTAGASTVPALQVQANNVGMPAGSYGGLIQVSSSGTVGSPRYVSATLNVLAAGSTVPELVQPVGLIFVGQAGGSPPPAQTLGVSSAALVSVGATVTMSTQSGGNWLTATPTSLSLAPSGTVSISVNPASLTAGVYAGIVTLAFGDGTAQNVNVLVVVPSNSGAQTESSHAAVVAGCQPSRLVMVMQSIGSNYSTPVGYPASLEAYVVDDCGNPAASATVIASFSDGDPPLPLPSIGNGIYSASWTPANQAAIVTLTVVGLESPLAPATLTISVTSAPNPTPPPSIGTGGVVNGASFAHGTDVAPGSIISVFGTNLGPTSGSQAGFPLPKILGGITLTIDGINAPLFYAGTGQVNAQLPFEIPANAQTQVVARAISGSAEFDAVSGPVIVSAAHPGIFTTNGTQGAILNVSYQLINASNPANPGDVIQIYCTGLGATNPPSVTGQAATSGVAVIVPTVTVGGLAAGLQYAGVAPGFVGLYQVNVTIPTGVTPGSAVPVVITQNGIASNAATIVVQ